jgi:hypothetical protein
MFNIPWDTPVPKLETTHPRLCAVCAQLFATPQFLPVGHTNRRGKHHQSYDDVKDASDKGCYICIKVHNTIVDTAKNRGLETALDGLYFDLWKSERPFQTFHIRMEYSDGSGGSHYFVIFEQTDLVREQLNTAIPSSTRDIQSIATARAWIDRCRTHHNCREGHSLPQDGITTTPHRNPTRLIFVQRSPDNETLAQLHSTAQLPVEAQYISVSHGWGGQRFLSLTTQNHAAFHESIPIPLLSIGFQDLIYMVIGLGYHYVWIDSLCIVQDDPEDWGREAKLMATVYRNAVCNISTSAFESGVAGFLPRARAMDPNLPILHIDKSSTEKAFVMSEQSPWDEIWEGPLFRRAWVLQEQVLVLNPCQSQVHPLIASFRPRVRFTSALLSFTGSVVRHTLTKCGHWGG